MQHYTQCILTSRIIAVCPCSRKTGTLTHYILYDSHKRKIYDLFKLPSTSLVTQRIGICQCKGHRFDPWSGEIPRASGKLSLCATTTEGHVP